MSALATRHIAKIERRSATIAEIASATDQAERTIRYKRDREHWEPGPDRIIDGKAVRTFFPPASIQIRLMNADLALVGKPTEGAAPQRLRPIDDLDADERKDFEESKAAIDLLLGLQQEGYGVTKSVEIATSRASFTRNGTPVTAKFFWRRWMAFSEGGLAALVPPKHNKRFGTTSLPEIVQDFIRTKYLRESIPNARLIAAILAREWKKLGVEGKPPSRGTVNTFIYGDKSRGIPPRIPAPVKTLAHRGPEALHAKHSGFIVRKAPPALEWMIADHRIFDVRVRNTMFGHLPDDSAFRLWMTAVYDWGSRYLMGYCFAPTPSSDTINSALRMALSRFGFPRNFYWDNGLDYKHVAAKLEEIKASESMRYLLLQHKIDFGLTSALPKHPRSKPIEAYFTRWSKRFDVLWQSVYRGNRPSNRPEAAAVADREHAKYLAGKRPDSPLPTDRDFILCADQWIAEYNGETRLESLDGRTPQEVLDEQAPIEQRKPAPHRILDALLMKDDVRTVLAGGCVEICRMRYEPKPEFIGPMFLAQGRKVLILRDPYHFEEAIAVDPESHEFIAELALLLPVDQVSNGQYTNDHLKTKLRTQRALERSCRDYIAAVAAGASIHGWQTEVEALRDRALARAISAPCADGTPLPASVAPGALPALPQRSKYVPESPFVDDAAKKVIAAMNEPNEES